MFLCLLRPLFVRTSDSGPPNHRNLMQKIQKTIVFHSFFKKLGVPMPIGRSRLPIGRSRLWIGRSRFLLGVLGYGLGVPKETIRGDYPKETIRRRLFEGDYSRRLFEGDYSKEWRTRYFLEWYLNLVPELGT